MSLIANIRNHLTAAGVVEGGTGWKCFLGFAPEVQDKVVLLQETGGFPADTLGNENEQATFQVTVRSPQKAYEEAAVKWRAVFNALQDQTESGGSPDYLDGIYLMSAMQTAPAVFYDEKLRVCMTVNFRVVRRRP